MKDSKVVGSVIFEEQQYVVLWNEDTKKVYVAKNNFLENPTDTLIEAYSEDDAKQKALDHLNGKIG